MKRLNKILSLVLAIAFLGVTTGCDSYFEDYIASPNDPVEVTPALLLTSVEVSTFASYGGQLARQSAIMIQHCAGTSAGSQSVEVANYNLTEQTNENEWNAIYTGAIHNAQIIIDQYGAENPYYAGVAKVLLALNFGIATDLWGDVPYSEAVKGLANLAPKFDSQEDVIKGIQTLLSEAVAEFAKAASANKVVPGGDDLIFGGDIAAWTKTAHALKARYANRLSQRDAMGSATAALTHLGNAGMADPTDDCNMIFGEGNALNQWYAFNQSRGDYVKVSKTFADSLINTADPRLPVLLSMDTAGAYSGTPSDDVDVVGTSYVGAYYASAGSPIPLISFVETKFIEAEAKLRSGDAGGAATALNDAVKASILQITGAADPTYEAAYAAETAGTVSLEKIMYQKWVALFIQVEAYADWRRTGFPTLTPNPNGNTATIPVRLVTAQNERLYNPNATVVGDVTVPVWWDN